MPSLPLPCRGTKPTPFSGELSFAQGQVKGFQDMQAESLQSSTVKSVQSARSDHCVLFSVYPYPSSEEPTCLSRVSLSIRVGDGSGVRQPRFRLFSLTADRTSAKATCTRHGMSGKQILLHPRHKDEQSRACHMCTGLTLHLPLHLSLGLSGDAGQVLDGRMEQLENADRRTLACAQALLRRRCMPAPLGAACHVHQALHAMYDLTWRMASVPNLPSLG